MCRWDKLGAFDVKQIVVNCVKPAEPASDIKTVQDALTAVLHRVERADGWAIDPRYRTGLAAYEMWAKALESGKAIYGGHAYLTQVWLECREMAVAFLQEAVERLPGRCDDAFVQALRHYVQARDRLRTVLEMHPERPNAWDWKSPLTSAPGRGADPGGSRSRAQGHRLPGADRRSALKGGLRWIGWNTHLGRPWSGCWSPRIPRCAPLR